MAVRVTVIYDSASVNESVNGESKPVVCVNEFNSFELAGVWLSRFSQEQESVIMQVTMTYFARR
jgi:hypothetical protein